MRNATPIPKATTNPAMKRFARDMANDMG
jgi:hypothetical protein